MSEEAISLPPCSVPTCMAKADRLVQSSFQNPDTGQIIQCRYTMCSAHAAEVSRHTYFSINMYLLDHLKDVQRGQER